MLTLTASGSVSDFLDTSSLQQNVASAAGIDDRSLVTISVAAGSVLITATIAVPAYLSATTVQSSLSSSLATVAAATSALGIPVESVPSVVVASPAEPGVAEELSLGAIAGIAAGGAVAVALVLTMAGASFYICRKMNRELKQAKKPVGGDGEPVPAERAGGKGSNIELP